MDEVKELGVTHELTGFNIIRLDVDTEHHYFGQMPGQAPQYFVALTHILDIGAPFPEGLREYLRVSTFEEQKERLEMTGARGTKLHDALDRLMNGETLNMENYPTRYEKEALVTFIQVMRFLQPKKFFTEIVVADPALRVAGTLDLKCTVAAWKLAMLLDPLKYLEIDSDGDLQPQERWLDLPSGRTQRVIIDYKFTGRNTYNHKVQVAKYKHMNNISRPKEGMVSRAFTWRYSPKHKYRFDFQESKFDNRAFKRIYDTALDYLGEFPEAPEIKVYPKEVSLFKKKEEK